MLEFFKISGPQAKYTGQTNLLASDYKKIINVVNEWTWGGHLWSYTREFRFVCITWVSRYLLFYPQINPLSFLEIVYFFCFWRQFYSCSSRWTVIVNQACFKLNLAMSQRLFIIFNTRFLTGHHYFYENMAHTILYIICTTYLHILLFQFKY